MKRQLLLYFSLGFKFIPGHFSGYDKSQAFAKDYSWTGTACGSCILISSYSPKEVKAEELKRIHLKQFWLFWICPEKSNHLEREKKSLDTLAQIQPMSEELKTWQCLLWEAAKQEAQTWWLFTKYRNRSCHLQ